MKHGNYGKSGDGKLDIKRGGIDEKGDEHVKEAEKYVDGRNVEGVNIETGWSKGTKYTGKHDDA